MADLPLNGQQRRQLVLERAASGSALVERYAAAGGTADRAEEVLEAARCGDPVATAIISDAASTLGTGMALLANLQDPEAMIVGGGLGSADTPYWSSAVAWARRYMYSDAAREMPIQMLSSAPTQELSELGLSACSAPDPADPRAASRRRRRGPADGIAAQPVSGQRGHMRRSWQPPSQLWIRMRRTRRILGTVFTPYAGISPCRCS
jgi:predicted NBD/HSP70 family sugar kinase